ncbi:MAG TPA: fasciclin domain-containing protein [Prolixibacteraceae bacterium]
MTSCETEPDSSSWGDKNALTISQYLDKNKHEYSKSYRLLVEGKLLTSLYAYNPYGDYYTLFLPTDEAIDRFLLKNPKYGNFEELLKDTSFIKRLTRYHTLNRRLRTNEFPDGGLVDRTLTGDRLVTSFFSIGDNQLIKINNVAPIIKPNLEMTNGNIHVISEVLQPVDISGYDWLQQQKDYSIVAQAMKLSGIQKKLKWVKYTLFAEPDSIFHRYGINNVEELISRIGSPGVPLTTITNTFYQFAAYHIVNGDYYMNDFYWGSKKYLTLGGQQLTISVGQDIRINPGIDTYGLTISESGDTTEINYIRPISEGCNILTRTGPVHSISELMYYLPLP